MNAPVANAANEVASTLDQSVILEAIGVSMVFPGTIALDNADFVVRKSAVTALVGENGAGKSTLMKILAGVNSPTSGELRLNGETVVFNSVHDASAKGIGIVFQELNLCPNLSIAENIFLTHPYTKGGVHIDRARQTAHAAALLKRLEHDLSPDTRGGELRIGEQQIVEIAKALSRDVQVLIMDEPTSALSESEVEVLFRVIDELRRSGVAIIYISHRLEELTRIADYVSVLRDGKMQNSARLALKSAQKLRVVAELVLEHLDGDDLAGAEIDRAVNMRHAAGSDEVYDTITMPDDGSLCNHTTSPSSKRTRMTVMLSVPPLSSAS